MSEFSLLPCLILHNYQLKISSSFSQGNWDALFFSFFLNPCSLPHFNAMHVSLRDVLHPYSAIHNQESLPVRRWVDEVSGWLVQLSAYCKVHFPAFAGCFLSVPLLRHDVSFRKLPSPRPSSIKIVASLFLKEENHICSMQSGVREQWIEGLFVSGPLIGLLVQIKAFLWVKRAEEPRWTHVVWSVDF